MGVKELSENAISDQAIETRARFDIIRYAQGWEDAEVLIKALTSGSDHKKAAGKHFLSVAAAGDNVLALLLLDPQKIVAADLSQAQLYCLQMRIEAFKHLSYDDFIELMEPTPSNMRRDIARNLISDFEGDMLLFWQEKLDAIEKLGLAGIGKFENYFSLFRRYILPFIASKKTCNELFQKMSAAQREEFFNKKWNNWRWRLATKFFFSEKMMGKLGRDPAFFDYAEGNLPKQVQDKVRHAVINMKPHDNPYMQWILLGHHQYALPLAWRKEHYQTIKDRVDRIEFFKGPIQEASGRFDGFNLSDIFEYMSPSLSREVYEKLLDKAQPDARFVYWNMMVKRQMSVHFSQRVKMNDIEASKLALEDKAFFYSALIIEDVLS